LGFGLGTILWGFVAEYTGYSNMFFATLVFLVLAAGLAWRARKPREHSA
jgi:predicted MFS family arabinose efflux permease